MGDNVQAISAHNSGRAAAKAIVLLGALAFGLLMLTSFGLKKSLKPNPRERVSVGQKYSPFDRGRAFEDLKKLVAEGPRPAGSEALQRARAHVQRELAMAGVEYREHTFTADGIEMANVVATLPGGMPGYVLVGTHFDTAANLVGANDGAAGAAWLLELARCMAQGRRGRGLMLVWFDGNKNGLQGSRAFVNQLKEAGQLEDIDVMVNVDMIGDCYLRLQTDNGAPEWLLKPFMDTGRKIGYGDHLSPAGVTRENDYLPFREAGVASVLLTDFIYGGSIIDHQKNWNTAEDTLDRVCAESLQAVADLFYHALPALEQRLDTLGAAR